MISTILKSFSLLLFVFHSLFTFTEVNAQALPDANQYFTGYSKMGDGSDRMISPDNFFILSASRNDRLNADNFGAYISDTSTDHGGITDWFEITVNPGSDLGSFELTDVFVGEYDYGVHILRFEDVIISAYQGETLIAETTPYASQSDDEETRYPIDYSVFEGISIDRFRVTFTTKDGTPPDTFNLVEFTIKEASSEATEPSNQPPVVANPIPDQSGTQDAAFSFTFDENTFSDPDGDDLSYSAQLAGGDPLPAWLSFDAATRNFSGTPTATDTGTIIIEVTADDGNGGTITESFNLAVHAFPTVTAEHINISGASGDGGTYTIGDMVTATWDNTTNGDNNEVTITGVIVDFSEFGGGSETEAVNDGDIWSASYTITYGSINDDNRNISVFSTNDYGTTTTTDNSNVSVNNVAFSIGFGTESEPYEIATADQLNYVRDFLESHFIQTANIDLGVSPWNVGEGWEPIGKDADTFIGSLDGNGHIISNLFIDRSTEGIGLFGYIGQGGQVSNIRIWDANITSSGPRVGILAGNLDGDVTKTEVSGTISAHGRVGGLAGSADENATTTEVAADITITSTAERAGGLFGSNNGNISNSYAYGSVTGSARVGGLIGNNHSGTVSNNYVAVELNGGSWTRGLVGDNAGGTYSNNFVDEDVANSGSSGNGTFKSTDEMKTKSTFIDAGWDFADTWKIDEPSSGGISYPYLQSNTQNPPPGFIAVELPIVVTHTSIDQITSGSAEVSGEVTNDGNLDITATGFVWATDDAPGDTTMIYSGSLNETITDLPPGTALNVRAFAENAVGLAYGDPVPFQTLQGELQIAGTFTAQNKIYDGGTTAPIDQNDLALDGVYSGHDVSLTDIELQFSDPNVDNGLEVTLSSASLSGDDAGRYTLTFTGAPAATADITPRAITIAANVQQVVYGEADPALSYDISSGSLVSGDGLSGSLARTSGAEVGTYSIYQGDLDAGSNYDLTYVSADFEISPRTLNVVAAADQSKAYGETDPSFTFEATNFGWSDDVALLTGSLDRTAGEDVGQYAIAPGDLDAGRNYTINFTAAGFEITPKILTIVADSDQSRVYGDSDPELTFEASGFVFDDDQQIISGALNRVTGEDVGTFEIGAGDLDAGDNYVIYFTTADFEITPRALMLTNFVADNKTYDGTTDVSGAGFDDDRLGNDDLEFSFDAAFANKNAGVEKEVNFTNLQVSGGDDAANYTLQSTSGQSTAEITKRAITIVADAATIIYGEDDPYLTYEITTGSLVSGDELSGGLSRKTGMNVGVYSIEQGSLTAGNNYQVTYQGAEFEITPRELLIKAKADQGKTYGEDDPALTFEVENFGWSDDESVLSGALARDAGEDVDTYTINRGDLDAGENYTIDFTDASFEITRRELIVEADASQTKLYGEDDPELSYETIGLHQGDDQSIITGKLSRQSGEHAGMYKITIGNLDAGNNYLVTFKDAKFEITQRTLTILAEAGQSKVYGDNDPAFMFEAANFGWDDDEYILAGALSRESGIDAGKYNITLNTLNAGDNYAIDFTSAEFNVLPKELVVVADNDQWKFIGEEDPSFSYQANGFEYNDDESVLSGLLERETGEEPGQYSITMGSLDAGNNYDISLIGSDFSILMTAPKADRLTPEADQMKVSTEMPVVVEFDQEIISVDPGLITLKDADGNEFTIDAVAGIDRLTLNHTGLTNQKAYTVTVPEGTVKNSDEILNRDIEWSFTTIMAEPVVTGYTPHSNEEMVSVSNEIIVEFSQPVSVADAGKVILTDSNESIIATTVTTNEEHLTLEHEGLSYLTQYTVTLLEGAVHNTDEVQNSEYSWSFTTVIKVPDPVVLKTPVGGLGSVSLHPIVEWEESEFAEAYRVQISSSSSFESVVVDQEEITELSWATADDLDGYTGYFWRVEALNTSGSSGWSETGEFYTLAVTPDPVFPIQNSEQISIAPTLEWTSGYETQFRVQLSETENFVSLLSDSLTAETAFGLTGLDSNRNYYWRVRVESDRTTSEWLDAQSFLTRPAPQDDSENYLVLESIDFGGTSNSENRQISQMDYRMIGLPGGEQYKLMDFFEGKYGTEWKAFLENGADTEYYEEFDASDNRFVFAPGEGFWVLSKDILELDLNIRSVEINEKDAYRVSLHPGWNIISNPHRNTVSWQDVRELNDISMVLYGYDQRFTIEDSLRSVQGFYIYNDPNNLVSTIDIPYTQMRQRRGENGMAAEKAGLQSAMKVSPSSAVVSASFNNGHTFSAELIYNVSPGDEGRYLKYYPSLEMSKTGMMFTDDSIRRGGLIRGESRYDETGGKYRLELKGYVGDTFEWEARLKGLGNQARVLLVNPATNLTWLLAHGETAEVKLSEPHAIYSVYIGNEEYLINKQQSIMPVEISLNQNYPNPFNPTTNIRFAITEQQHVRLEIYDVIGRRVQVLQDGILQAGWHNAQFDGRSLASGIYFYRLQTGSVVKVRQMSMIK